VTTAVRSTGSRDGKCATITQDFTNAAQDGALAGIGTLSNDIYNDVKNDAAVSSALRAWKACMARNGYSFTQPANVFFQALHTMSGGKGGFTVGETVSPAADQAQIATAVTDADCTQFTDLAGIYFAKVRELPSLLKTASANPFSTSPAGRPTSANG
jgi:hypothetical protein